MVHPTRRLDDPAQQPSTDILSKPLEGRAIEGDGPIRLNVQNLDGGLGQVVFALRPVGGPGRRGRPRGHPQARPLEARVTVGRIVDPGHAARHQGCREACTGHREQRPQETNLRLLHQGGHAGKAVRAALPRRAHRYGFRLIVGVVAQQQMQDATPATFLAQQPVARRPGSLLQAAARLRAGPKEDRRFAAVTLQDLARGRGLRWGLRT